MPRQRGLRATEPTPAGTVLGLVAGHLLTYEEWHELKVKAPGAEEGDVKETHWAWEIAHESYCSELTAPGADDDDDDSDTPKLYLSSFGYGRIPFLWRSGGVVTTSEGD